VKLAIKDLDALDEACARLGLDLRRDKKTFSWWGRFMNNSIAPAGRDPRDYGTCDHAIGRAGTTPSNGNSGEWEIGVVRAVGDPESFELLLDTYGSAGHRLMAPCGGVGLPTLRREYAVAVARRKATATLVRKGFVATREDLAGGRVRLRLRKR